jgi:hypothetical protein
MQHGGPFLDPNTLGKCLVRGSSEHCGFCVPKRVLVRHERAYSDAERAADATLEECSSNNPSNFLSSRHATIVARALLEALA